MAAIDGFWSYVHVDDDAESGRIAQLARDVATQFEMMTGESINLFLDRDRLMWGDDWRPKIDTSLSSIAFFVPVITPRYFKSKECRRELNFFARQAERIGIKELVLPVLWVDFPALHEEFPVDDLLALVNRFQWSDWGDRKFSELGSGEYRRAVAQLAERLVHANSVAESSSSSPAPEVIVAEDGDDEMGMLDKLSATEQSIPRMAEILTQASRVIEDIGDLMLNATGEMRSGENSGAVLANRLRVARKMAVDLSGPADEIRSLGSEFANVLNEVDEGVRIIITRAPYEINESSASRANFEGFFDGVRGMVRQSEVGLGAVSSMVAQIEPVEKMSRDLRKPLRTLREGLTLFVDGLTIMREWIILIDEAESSLQRDSEGDFGNH